MQGLGWAAGRLGGHGQSGPQAWAPRVAGEARPCSCVLGGGSPRLLSCSSPWEAIWTRSGGRVEAQHPHGLLLRGSRGLRFLLSCRLMFVAHERGVFLEKQPVAL